MSSSNTVRDKLAEMSDQWWLAPVKGSPTDRRKDGKDDGKRVARDITRAATQREIANIPQRWRNLCFYRIMTGRPALSQFAYGMSKRPQSMIRYYGQFAFGGMKSGFAATMCDVYINRLLGHETVIEMITNAGDTEQQIQADDIDGWLEGGFDELNYWRERTTACIEALWYGTGFLKFGDDGQGTPQIKATNPDELLYSNPDDTDPYDVIQRVWAKKTELLEEHKNNAEAVEAILHADTAYPAFYFGGPTLDCSDVIAYLEGWTRPIGKIPGRHVKVFGDYTSLDEEWDYPHPFERWSYDELPGSILGKGITENLYQISDWIDALLSTIVDADQRAGAPKWAVEENSNVNPDVLGDLNGAIVSYLGAKPELIRPESIGDYAMNRIEFLMNWGRSRVHVSEAAMKGEVPAGITAAIAIEKIAQIDDQNFLEKIGRLEGLDRASAYQLLMLGKRLKPRFTRRGNSRKQLDWKSIKLNANFRINDMAAFNVGRLGQTVAGRVQMIETLKANGSLSQKRYLKYLAMPDTAGMFKDLTAGTTDIDMQLDELVKSKEYIPPTPFMNLDDAKEAVETRIAREETDKSPQHVLDNLFMWRQTILSFMKQNSTPDIPIEPGEPAAVNAAPAPDAFTGITPPGLPGGAPPAVPPPPGPSLPMLNTSQIPA